MRQAACPTENINKFTVDVVEFDKKKKSVLDVEAVRAGGQWINDLMGALSFSTAPGLPDPAAGLEGSRGRVLLLPGSCPGASSQSTSMGNAGTNS